jgi:predicted transcriptional regulator
MTTATTSLKLPADVRSQAQAAARRQGLTPHAFMVDAIRNAAEAAQKRAEFVAQARAAHLATQKSGKGYSAADVHTYFLARASGSPARKPRLKAWRT